jgi:hypothetical protein
MGVKLDPIAQDIQVYLREDLSPQAKSKAFAQFARDAIAETDAKNDAAAGRDVKYQTFVDGSKSESLETVRPNGTIAAEWDIITDLFQWIHEQLVQNSPIDSGQYARSHEFYADDSKADWNSPPAAQNYYFVNAQPYARKIEAVGNRPVFSRQAPHGVYQVVAALAARRFSNSAIIRFTFRSPEAAYVALGGRKGGKTASASKRAAHDAHNASRNPAILILPR